MKIIGLGVQDERLMKMENKLKPLINLSLEKQCRILDIQLKLINVINTSKKTELIAKKYLLNKGNYKDVFYMESRFISLFDIILYDYVFEQIGSQIFGSGYLNYIFNKENKKKLIDHIKDTNKAKFKKNIKFIIRIHKKYQYPDGLVYMLNSDSKKFTKIFSCISREKLVNAAKIYLLENSFYSGWPDLVSLKKREIDFIEVKTTDNLMLNQMFIIESFRRGADFNMKVLKIYKV